MVPICSQVSPSVVRKRLVCNDVVCVAQPWVSSTKINRSMLRPPDCGSPPDWASQVSPPSRVWRMVVASPVTQPTSGVTKKTDVSCKSSG